MKLSENYRLLNEDSLNVVLQYHEKRVNKNTGVEFEYTENYYYPTIKAALISYVNKDLKAAKSIKEIIQRIENLEKKIL